MLNKYFKASIKLEKNMYIVGEQINGLIYLNIKTKLLKNNILLNLIGEEKIQFHYNESVEEIKKNEKGEWVKTKVNKHTRTNEGINHLNKSYNIKISDTDDIDPGNYQIPFSIILENNIPSSFHKIFRSCSKDSYAFICYYFTVNIFNNYNNEVIDNTKYYFIVNNPKIFEENNIMVTEKLKIPDFLCFYKGTANIKFELNSNCWSPDKDLNGKIIISSDYYITNTKIILEQILTIKDNKNNVYKNTSNIQTINLGNYNSHPNYNQEYNFSIRHKDIKLDGPNIYGNFIKNEYKIYAKINNGKLTCCLNPNISIPLTISQIYNNNKMFNKDFSDSINIDQKNIIINNDFISYPKFNLENNNINSRFINSAVEIDESDIPYPEHSEYLKFFKS